MNRKRQALFLWSGATVKKLRLRGQPDPNDQQERKSNNPQIDLLLKTAPRFDNSLPLPYELMIKIFKFTVDSSDNPIKDLCNMALVCEDWRQMILQAPSLWSRLDLSKVPATDRNLSVISRVFKKGSASYRLLNEVIFSGELEFKSAKSAAFLETLVTAPNMTTLSFKDFKPQSRQTATSFVHKLVRLSKKLKCLTITQSKSLFTNQKWLADHLMEHGRNLQVLNLALSLTSVTNQLIRALSSSFCPNLKFLDISTCDALNTRSFDAVALSQNIPSLEVLRVANVSFKRVHQAPEVKGLRNLKELSMPIGMRDADRDDSLFATLAYGSDKITCLDLRGASVTPHALLDMPSYEVQELHLDDLCPIGRKQYHEFIAKWAQSLEVLSLVKINCSETMKKCLQALYSHGESCKIRELDLSSSDVTGPDLLNFLKAADHLDTIKLSSCRSLPRGCKANFGRDTLDQTMQDLDSLIKRLENCIYPSV